MTAGPRARASGERHVIARGIEAEGRDAALRLGSREPGAFHRTRHSGDQAINGSSIDSVGDGPLEKNEHATSAADKNETAVLISRLSHATARSSFA